MISPPYLFFYVIKPAMLNLKKCKYILDIERRNVWYIIS